MIELEPGESTEVLLLLGEVETAADAQELIERYRAVDCETSLREVRDRWEEVLGTIQIETPDPAFNLMLNRWLLYQTLSCRVWARSAFYQSGGAFGFRDQLQDTLALTISRPDLVRSHLLRAAARQFRLGDVQHWWHPPTGRGVRTRISDDRLWLPYAALHYINTTNDRSVLDEEVPWLDAPHLEEHEQEKYFQPQESQDCSTLYEHCAKALDYSLQLGSHGLPLIGAGDWNDGMNRVGWEGRGESVWLGWFLVLNLKNFAPVAVMRGEIDRAAHWLEVASSIERSLDQEAWDGDWYRRAFFDDGTPLGSVESEECKIDSIAQSWAVLSGAADAERARRAMDSVDLHLVNREERLIQLFTPPFDQTQRDPGYIKGYLPGIRENGGQYTHAAIWSVAAFAALGDGDKAAELFGMLSPINHTRNRAELHQYKVEPYVVPADVYSQPPHVGRGGWTWYTGAAGWLYRAGLEWILGIHKLGTTLRIDPCIPKDWGRVEIAYRFGNTVYRIAIENPDNVCRGVSHLTLDDSVLPVDEGIPLSNDGGDHSVRVVLGDGVK